MMLGFFPAFLAAPTMTVGHLLFAGLGCAYILVGVRLEERDLTARCPSTPRTPPSLRGSCHASRVVGDLDASAGRLDPAGHVAERDAAAAGAGAE